MLLGALNSGYSVEQPGWPGFEALCIKPLCHSVIDVVSSLLDWLQNPPSQPMLTIIEAVGPVLAGARPLSSFARFGKEEDRRGTIIQVEYCSGITGTG
jgi:hypothetical protein